MKLTKSCTGTSMCISKPITNFLSITLLLFLLSTYAQAQQTIQGIVVDAQTNEPLSGATIKLKNTQTATRANEDGRFTIQLNRSQGILEASYLGYESREVTFKDPDKQLTFALQPNESVLEEVEINAGYYSVTDRERTGSISQITAEEIGKQPVTNVLSALSGRMPGVYVQTTNGLPGGNINIKIRGTGSIAAGTQPLYIIDGVPFDGSPINEGHSLSVDNIVGALSPLNMLNPNNVESITVLKDADATAIYGSRGSNGVVLITTKRAKTGDTRINVNLRQGFHKAASFPDLLNLEEYLEMRREAFANDGKEPSSDPTSPNYAPDLTVWSQTDATDWAEYMFGRNANFSSVQARLLGGNSNTSFNISANFHQEGTILNADDSFRRIGFHSRVHHRSTSDRFSVNASVFYNRNINRLANPTSGLFSAILLPPNYPLNNPDGSYNWMRSNILAEAHAKSHSTSDNSVYNLKMRYELVPNLNLRASFGYNSSTVDQSQIFPTESLQPGMLNFANFGLNNTRSFIAEPQIDYSLALRNAKLRGLVGFTYQSKSSDNRFIRAADFNSESLMHDFSAAESLQGRSRKYLDYRYVSVFGRLEYGLHEKLFFSGTIRRDGSSRFSRSSRFGTFSSVGAAWLFGEEKWMENAFSQLSFGKIRASYGTSGNDQIPDYQYLATYRSLYVYQGNAILQPANIANPLNYHWETTRKLEFAIELGFWENRLRLNASHFRHRSDDQLVNYKLPRITGFSYFQANLPAVVQNTGWEFELSSRNIENEIFSWNTSFNLTLPRNKLISFENFENSSYVNSLEIGYDITRITGRHFLGVDPLTGLPQFADESGKPITEGFPYSYHTLGKGTPEFYGGIGNVFQLKHFQLDVFFQFSQHGIIGGMMGIPGASLNNGYSNFVNRWQNEGDNTVIPKSTTSTGNSSYYGRSNANFFDVTYFRLKNVSLSYAFPNSILSRIGVRDFRVFCEGQNIVTIWDRSLPLFDPESGGMSNNNKTIPPLKSFILGVQLTI